MRAREALDAVELGRYLRYHPDQLSGGMKQRVSPYRALAFEPDIFLIDETAAAGAVHERFLFLMIRGRLPGSAIRCIFLAENSVVFRKL